jgi:hypothetical protein
MLSFRCAALRNSGADALEKKTKLQFMPLSADEHTISIMIKGTVLNMSRLLRKYTLLISGKE